MTNGGSLLLFPLGLLFVVLLLILLIYFLTRIGGKGIAKGHLPDPRFMGSTAFLMGVNGSYKDAIIPIPIEGIVIGSNANVANIILTGPGISSQHVRVSFPDGRYDCIVTEDLGSKEGTYYWQENEWIPLTSQKIVAQDMSAKIKIGTFQDIFEIIFRS